MIRRLAPFAIIAGGFLLAFILLSTGPTLEPRPPEAVPPLVRVIEVSAEPVQMTAKTNGTVIPRTQSELVPEVSGRVVGISPDLVSGGFFKAGDLLLEIDPTDYEVQLEQARAGLARARSELDNAERAYARQLDLAERQSTSDAQKDDALNRLRIARASVAEAEALLSRAERDLARTEIVAPYDGRVRSERADLGQFVNRGNPIATIYATDIAEVRLPVNDDVLAFFDVPLTSEKSEISVPVRLSARFAGARQNWEGEIVRTEGEIDPQTRMINLVAQVEAPYEAMDDRAPLAVGLFVDAEILGTTLENIFVLPRSAMQSGVPSGSDLVYVVDAEGRLSFREVAVVRTVGDKVYIASGLQDGERVCISTMDSAVDGMTVRAESATTGQVARS